MDDDGEWSSCNVIVTFLLSAQRASFIAPLMRCPLLKFYIRSRQRFKAKNPGGWEYARDVSCELPLICAYIDDGSDRHISKSE